MKITKTIEQIKAQMLIGVFATLFLSTPISAAPIDPTVDWTILDVTFDDGTALNGSFAYDAVANRIDTWFLETTTSSNSGSVSGYSYNSGTAYISDLSSGYISFERNDDSGFLEIAFSPLLSNNGGTFTAETLDVWEEEFSPLVARGSLSTAGSGSYNGIPVSAVPVPAAVWLFGSGLLGLIGVARRKKV